MYQQPTILRTMVTCLLAAALAGQAHAEEPDWKVGLAKVKITPERPVFLAGYASRNRPFEKVTADLYAKALALEDREGNLAVLVTTDLIGLSAAIAEPICTRLAERAGLKREQILLTSSHIHTGPTLSLNPQTDGDRSADDSHRTLEYTSKLQDQLVELVVESLKKREPARLSWGTGVANFVLNRRQFTPRGVILGMNARGPADRTVPVLRIDTAEGQLRGVLFGAATHNTTLRPNCYELCGDYAGFAQANLEERHPDVQAMFILGFAGDSDPYPHGTMELARQHGLELSQEVERVLATKLEPVRGPLRVALDKAKLPLELPSREELEKRAATDNRFAAAAQKILASLDKGEQPADHYAGPVAVWQFGDDLTLVALSGEVVVDYVALLEKALGPNRLWLSAYANDVYGYLPSARLIAEGGYETRGVGGINFSPRAEAALVGKVRELADKVGRDFRNE
ncbi:MAG: neutral/alkaline non-lysosomal ceramidase N-terminal domain-containing protein [Pirellulaceae bacterium]